MKTKGIWQGVLTIEEGSPKKVRIGKFNINSIFHFLSGKRIILIIDMLPEENQAESGQLSTIGKLEFDEKKKEFLFERYPIVEILEGFEQKEIKIEIELDESVLSSRM
jgi:hypothetical protein